MYDENDSNNKYKMSKMEWYLIAVIFILGFLFFFTGCSDDESILTADQMYEKCIDVSTEDECTNSVIIIGH